jgi:hypothetical protein
MRIDVNPRPTSSRPASPYLEEVCWLAVQRQRVVELVSAVILTALGRVTQGVVRLLDLYVRRGVGVQQGGGRGSGLGGSIKECCTPSGSVSETKGWGLKCAQANQEAPQQQVLKKRRGRLHGGEGGEGGGRRRGSRQGGWAGWKGDVHELVKQRHRSKPYKSGMVVACSI